MDVVISIPAAYGRLVTDESDDSQEYEAAVPCARPRDAASMQQSFRVLSTAENHKHFRVTFSLYLESPGMTDGDLWDMVLVDRVMCRLQVSSTYIHRPNARFLLITNPKTTERQSQAAQHFIRDSLGMEVDLCNIHQNGGLLQAEDDGGEAETILSNYVETTAIFLDNPFDFFDAGSRTTSQLCDPQWLHRLAINKSTSVFLGSSNSSAFEKLVGRSIMLMEYKCAGTIQQVKPSHHFNTPEAFVASVVQEK